jgi:ribonuclease D
MTLAADEHYIDTPEALADLCAELKGSAWLTVDTEFQREKTYYAQLALIQVANENTLACIDPVALDNFDPFLELLYDPNIVKVFHAARQDLEIFFEMKGSVPQPLFDTQIAATLAGFGDQIGYANLVDKLTGVKLDKSHTRTNWLARPLDEDQIRYALNDVRYLRDAYHLLLDKLTKSNRLDWLQRDFDELTAPETYQAAPETLWRRIRGANRLKGKQLAVLQSLTAWRETEARNKDKPRRWMMKDEVLIDLARIMPMTEQKLRQIRGIEAGTVKRIQNTLFDLIGTAAKTPSEEWPQLDTSFARISANQSATVDAMMAALRLCAEKQEVSTATLASRKDLEKLVTGDQSVPLMHGWRYSLAGEIVEKVLNGELSLSVKDGQLILT